MKTLAVLRFAAVIALFTGFATPSTAADNKVKAKATTESPCHKALTSKPSQEAPVDLSGSGLRFDPRSPGGAHPVEEGRESVGVDPASVTLFPPSATNSISSEDNHEKSVPCRP